MMCLIILQQEVEYLRLQEAPPNLPKTVWTQLRSL